MSKPKVEWCVMHQRHEPIPSCEPVEQPHWEDYGHTEPSTPVCVDDRGCPQLFRCRTAIVCLRRDEFSNED